MIRNLAYGFLTLGLVTATVVGVVRAMPEPASAQVAFPEPSQRVAMAVEDVLRAEMASINRTNCDLTFGLLPNPPGKVGTAGTLATSPTVSIPVDSPVFFVTMSGATLPSYVQLGALPVATAVTTPASAAVPGPIPMEVARIDWQVTPRAGDLPVSLTVAVEPDPIGAGSVVNFGDTRLAATLAPKIRERLARPEHRHDSPEDRAALEAFFGGGKSMNLNALTRPPVGVGPTAPPEVVAADAVPVPPESGPTP